MAFCAHCGSHVAQVSFAPCASCGNPTNGAPPRPVRHSSTAAIIIGVVAGGFVVIAIIGILAAIAIPNLLTAMQRSRQKRTMADMRVLATKLEEHRNEKGAWPEKLEDLGAVPQNDAWTHPFSIEVFEDGYIIGSGGADKYFDRKLPEYTAATTGHFDCDIIFANGQFVQAPGGGK